MKYRLQGYVAHFGDSLSNAFDLDAWRSATTLRHFGVGLKVRAGAMRVALIHIAPDGTRTRLAELDCPDPGAAFSPPLHLDELAGLLQPVIEAQSEGAEYDLYFGTGDIPATPWLRLGFLAAADTPGIGAGYAESFGHYLRIYGDRPASHLVLIDSGGAGDVPPAPDISVLANDATGMDGLGRGLYEACYGSLAAQGFTHLCLIGDGLRLDPEMFARSAALLRFLRPGLQFAAPLYPAAQGPDRPGPEARFGWRAGDRIAAPDSPLDSATGIGDLAALRDAAAAIAIPGPWWGGLALHEIHRCGLPDPLLEEESWAEFALRLRAGGVELAIPFSLWALPSGSERAPGAPPRRRLRNRALRLALSGVLETPGQLRAQFEAPIRAALKAEDFTRAAALIGALDDLLAGPDATPAEIPPAPALPPHPSSTRSLLGLRLRALLEQLERDWPARLAACRDTHARSRTIGHWAQAAGNRPPDDPAATLPDLRREMTALQRQLADAYTRMAELRDELHRARQADSDRVAALLRRNRLENTPQVLGDLDRASLVALHLLRGRHAGRRGVIIGNGPSLQIADLERLRGAVTFASNKIYLAFDETTWRPSYYSIEDSLVVQQNRDRIAALQGVTKIFPDNMRQFGYQRADTIFIPFRPPASFENPLSDPAFPDFSTDLSHGICWGSTIVYSQIQMALYMGCSEIVLIGLDHDYQLPETRQGRFYVHEGEQNHFHPEYRSPGETWHPPNLEVLEVSFARARERCAEHGVRILNASRRSRLEVFERGDFDTLFPPGEADR